MERQLVKLQGKETALFWPMFPAKTALIWNQSFKAVGFVTMMNLTVEKHILARTKNSCVIN